MMSDSSESIHVNTIEMEARSGAVTSSPGHTSEDRHKSTSVSHESRALQCSHMEDDPVDKENNSQENIKEEREAHFSNVPEDPAPPLPFMWRCPLEHYRLVFAFTAAFQLLPCLVTLIFIYGVSYESVFPIDFRWVPMDVKTDVNYLRYQAVKNSRKHLRPSIADELNLVSSLMDFETLLVIYEAKNVLTQECLQAIADIETSLTNFSLWQEWGLKYNNRDQVKPTSILRYFDGSISPEWNDTGFVNITKIMVSAFASDTDITKLLAADAVVERFGVESRLTMSVFSLVNRSASTIELEDFWRRFFRPKLDEMVSNGKSGMKIYFYNYLMFETDTANQVYWDIRHVAGSLFVTLLLLLFQTQSLFVACMGLVCISTNFLSANLVYQLVLDVRYFGIFHAISLFYNVIIGVMDLIIFLNMWRFSGGMELPNVEERFRYTYLRAWGPMLMASLTTVAAMAPSILAPMWGLRTFSWFSSLLVLANFMSATTFFPASVLLYHMDFESFYEWPWTKYFKKTLDPEHDSLLQEPSYLVRCCRKYVYRVVTHRMVRQKIIIVFSAFAIYAAYLASNLEISTRDFQYYRPGHHYYESINRLKYQFLRTLHNSRMKVWMTFGLKEQDMSMCKSYDYTCEGSVVFDDLLDLNPPAVQVALWHLCNQIKHGHVSDDLYLYRNNTTNEAYISCFIYNMHHFFQNFSRSVLNSSMDMSIPVTGVKMMQFLHLMDSGVPAAHLEYTNPNFYRYFEDAIEYWLTNAYKGNFTSGENFNYGDVELSRLVGIQDHQEDLSLTSELPSKCLRLRVFTIECWLTLFDGHISYNTAQKALVAWESLTQRLIPRLPPTLGGFQVLAGNQWNNFIIAKKLHESAIEGILAGLIVVFLGLILLTKNLVLSFLGLLNILLVLACFAGLIARLGYLLSIVEALTISLVACTAGYYVVHLSSFYSCSPFHFRECRLKHTLEHMGISFLYITLAIVGSASFLLLSEISFFFQFGLFMVIIALLSLVFSVCWFTPMLSLFGPEGTMGNLNPLCKWLCRKTANAALRYTSAEAPQQDHIF